MICLSLSDLLHLAWSSLAPSMLLQMALFHSFSWLSNIPLYLWTTSSLSIPKKSLDLRNMGKLSHLFHIPQNQTCLFTEVPLGWAGPREAVTHGCFLEGSFSTANCSDAES